MLMEEALESWEDEGGSAPSIPVAAKRAMKGTTNQVAWAEQIKTQVNEEFDRVAKALELAASKRVEQDRADIQLMIAILEDKRAEVMANDRAGYFIHDWQELRGQVRELIAADPRYHTIQASRAARRQSTPPADSARIRTGIRTNVTYKTERLTNERTEDDFSDCVIAVGC